MVLTSTGLSNACRPTSVMSFSKRLKMYLISFDESKIDCGKSCMNLGGTLTFREYYVHIEQ